MLQIFRPASSTSSTLQRSREILKVFSLSQKQTQKEGLPSQVSARWRHDVNPPITTTEPSTAEEYGTKTVVRASILAHDPTHPLAPNISHNLQNPFYRKNRIPFNQRHEQPSSPDQSFTITFLGTGAGGRANVKRAPTSTALKLNGYTILFDAGEGTQRQLAMTKNIGVKELGKIFVTHLHADHVSGLLGVILQKEVGVKNNIKEGSNTNSSRSSNAVKGRQSLEIYGPVGLYNFIAMNVALTCSKINNLDLTVYELTGGNDKRLQRDYILKRSYRELANLNIKRRTIDMGKDGTWTIQKAQKMEELDVQGRDAHLRINIQAAEVHHLPGIQTFGYTVEETRAPAKIDVDKARNLGIAPGPKYRALKNGFSVMSDDGLVEVGAHDVIVSGSGKKARKLAILGDAWRVPNPMKKLCRNADLLVYEATLEEGTESMSRQRGHSTAKMAGELALEVNAKALAMNHISGRHDGQESIDAMVKCAEENNQGKSDIVVAHDFMMVHIPDYIDDQDSDTDSSAE